ncbi:MAG: DUF4861 family protein, partial [Candidatus Kariarchaeaceae archaeon]
MYVEAGWRQSGFKHIYMKDLGWDVLMAQWNASSDGNWQWIRSFWEADFGWHNGDYPDKLTISNVGPVRAVVQTESGIGYNGRYGVSDEIRASKTYTFYDNFAGIAQNIRLVGTDAVAASEDMTALYGGPLEFTSKFLDFSMNHTADPWVPYVQSNAFDTVYSPGAPYLSGNQSRYQPDGDLRKLNVSLMTEPYFGMFNSTGYGYGFYWGHFDYRNNIAGLDWSDGEIVVKYEFDQFPLGGINRLLLPFSDSADPNATIDAMVNDWTNEYYLITTSYVDELPPEMSIGTDMHSVLIYTADIDISTDAGESLAQYTPIVLSADEFQLPRSKLSTAVVMYAGAPLPTQADDLDGDGLVDEIVFLLPNAIGASTSQLFNLFVNTQGLTNGQAAAAIDFTIGDYNETYMDFLPASMTGNFNNGTHNAPAVDEVGEVA